MNRTLLLLPVFLVTAASATQPDCTSLHLNGNGTVQYMQRGQFWPFPQKHILNLRAGSVATQLCGLTFQSDGHTYTAQASHQQDLLQLLTGPTGAPQFTVTRADGQSTSVNVEFQLATPGSPGPTSLTAQFSGRADQRPPDDLSLTARVNGGPLRPLLDHGNLASYLLTTMQRIDVYAKSSTALSWQQLTVDLTNHRVTVR